MSNDSSTVLHCQSSEEPPGTSFLLFFMITAVVLGLPGNLLALWIFCFRMKKWKPHAIFLFNLMLADFLLLACVPFRIDAQVREEHWIYGEIFCRVNLYMLAVNRSASIGFMTAVALNRYFKVLHPLHCVSLMSPRHSIWLVGFIWTIVIVPRIPLLTTDLMVQKENLSLCRSFNVYENPPLAVTVHSIAYVTEFIPWIILLFCSARIICYLKRQQEIIKQKKFKKAIRSVVIISLVFTVCFLPAIITGIGALAIKKYKPEDCPSFHRMVLSFMVGIGISYLNNALDPVIYHFSSSMFSSALKSVFNNLRH